MRVEKRGLWCLQIGFSLILAGSLASQFVCAQVESGTIRGIVKNEAGEGAPGAEVVLRNEISGVERTTHSRSDGTYVFTPIEPGTYSVTVRLKGFAPASLGHLTVNIGQIVFATFGLHGAAPEGETSSSVPAPPPPAARNFYAYGVMVTEPITTLPLSNRNFALLAQLFAGVNPPQPTRNGLGKNAAFAADGVDFSQDNFLLDGVDNNVRLVDFLTGYPSVVRPAEDAVQEFRLQTGDYDAAVGGSAGPVLNTITRSGSNKLHGDIFEYYGNDNFNAADFFDNAANLPTAPLRKNQFGAALGGPLAIPNVYKGQNKTFFFVDYQGTRMHLGVPETETVPTLAERSSGFTNFSDLITAQPGCARGADLLGRTIPCGTILDPATTRLVTEGNPDPVTGRTATGTGYVRDAFPGNILYGTRIDPVAASLLGLYPTPNPNNTGIYDNFTTNAYRSQNDNSYDVRLDHTLDPHDQVFGRLSYFDAPVRQDGPFTRFGGGMGVADGGGYTQVSRSFNAAVNQEHVFSANTVNEFRIGYDHIHAARVQPFANDLSNIPNQYGIAAIPQVPGNGGLPTLDIGTYSPLGSSPFLYADDYDATVQVVDNVTKTVGAQIWHFGGEARYFRFATTEPPYSRGQFTFSGNYTSIPNILDGTTGAAQLMLTPTTTTVPGGVNYVGGPSEVQASNIANIDDRRYYLAGYFTDDWKLYSNLTVTLGVRWDWVGPVWEGYGAEAKFVPGSLASQGDYELPVQSALRTTQDQTPAEPFAPSSAFINALNTENIKLVLAHRGQLETVSKTNIGPRLGFAYQARQKLIIRAGGGLYYGGQQNEGILSNLGGNYPFQFNYDFRSPNDWAPIVYPYSGSGAPATIEQGLVGVTLQPSNADPNFMELRSYQTNYRDPSTVAARASASYQLAANAAVEIAYSGSLGRHIPVNPGFNLPAEVLRPGENNPQSFVPYPIFAYGGSLLQTEGNSYYHAGAITYFQRLVRGISVLANYTYSDTRTDARDLTYPGGEQPYRAPVIPSFGIKQDYGWANFDIRNAFHVSGGYELPAGKGKRFFAGEGIVSKVLSDWSLHWVLTAESGPPVTIPCDITTAMREGCYALLAANPGTGGVRQFWSPSAFANPAPAASDNPLTSTGTLDFTALGGAPAQVRGPSIRRLDLALHKDLKLSEKASLQFRIEAYNVTNHPNFAAPSILNFDDPANFGMIGATRDNPYDPRQIQFAVRINF